MPALEHEQIAPEDCPEPFWHVTHRYCPVCTWTERYDGDGGDVVSPTLIGPVVVPTPDETTHLRKETEMPDDDATCAAPWSWPT